VKIIVLIACILLCSVVGAECETLASLAELGERCSGLSSQLILSVIDVESKGNPYAINVNGVQSYQPQSLREALYLIYKHNRANTDMGLMQINYLTWGPVAGLTPMELLDPRTNVCVGSAILRKYIDKHGGWRGVGRYNAVSLVKQRNYILMVAKAFKRMGGI
jgi:soluble lytic murein transglycosylase-like protein